MEGENVTGFVEVKEGVFRDSSVEVVVAKTGEWKRYSVEDDYRNKKEFEEDEQP